MGSEFLAYLFHLLVLLIFPPLLLGMIAKTKAFFSGRKGPPIFQAYYDLIKLVNKGTVISHSSTVILKLAPPVMVLSLITAGLLLPFSGMAPIHFQGDLILFAYLLATARFLTILGALDVGSSFEGMGASREATLGALSELAFFMGLIVLSIASQSISLFDIFQWEILHSTWEPVSLLLFASFFLILLTENARMPIDDPTTHLELTMIHEVMVLDYGGPHLGLILYGSSLKLFLFIALTVSIIWPQAEFSTPSAFGMFLLKMVGMSVLVGIVEASNARLRLIKVPQLLVANFVLTVFALFVVLLERGF